MRWILLAALAACGGRVSNRYDNAQVGSPCTPAVESDATFDGFDELDVSVELPAPDADPGVIVCLANHFRGRATCPYGQDATASALPNGSGFSSGAAPCRTPDGQPVTGAVDAQCTDRRASKVVTWSCRCAAADGTTNNGSTYCSCPSGMACTQLVAPTGPPGPGDISGAYCTAVGSDFSFSACKATCDPSTTTCS